MDNQHNEFNFTANLELGDADMILFIEQYNGSLSKVADLSNNNPQIQNLSYHNTAILLVKPKGNEMSKISFKARVNELYEKSDTLDSLLTIFIAVTIVLLFFLLFIIYNCLKRNGAKNGSKTINYILNTHRSQKNITSGVGKPSIKTTDKPEPGTVLPIKSKLPIDIFLCHQNF